MQTISALPADLQKFSEGKHAQSAFPYLSAAEREFLISGICPNCWDLMFSAEEEKDDSKPE
jgi:hypothetical protein